MFFDALGRFIFGQISPPSEVGFTPYYEDDCPENTAIVPYEEREAHVFYEARCATVGPKKRTC